MKNMKKNPKQNRESSLMRSPLILGLSIVLCIPVAYSHAKSSNIVKNESVQSILQGRTIKGQIIDENNEPLIGVSVIIKVRMILTVVSTPTSDEISTSSKSSSTSASTVERPATARASFEKSPVLVFSNPALSSSCCCLRSSEACAAELSCFFLKISKNAMSNISISVQR